MCVSTGAGAQGLPPSLLACAHLTDDADRLRCFDREIQAASRAADAKGHVPAASAPNAAPAAHPLPPAASASADTFGHPAPAPVETKRLEAHIASVAQGGPRPRFVLDNGQTWQQVDIDDTFQAKVGDPVVLTKGMLGSYFMSAGAHAAVRVARVK